MLVLAVASAAGGLALAVFRAPWLLAVTAFLGMANGMGRDRGAALVIEFRFLPEASTGLREL